MKQLSLLFLSLVWTSVSSQIVLTNVLTPAVGDSFYYAIDTNFQSVTITPAGPNQHWDFKHLKRFTSRSDVYRNPSTGDNKASFPTADIMGMQGVNELYYKLYANRIELLGTGTRNGGGPFPGIGGATVYSKPVIVQRFPQHYQDTLSYQTTNSIKLAADIIPDSILNTLPIKPDSFRVNFNARFKKEVDAWGTLSLPFKTWNVLREKQVTTNTTTVDAKVAFFGWIDITTLASGLFAGFFGSFTSYSYAFVSNETKGLIALVNTDSTDNVQNVQFKPDDKIILKADNTVSLQILNIFPNPALDEIYCSTGRLPLGQYQLTLIDMQGKSNLIQSIQVINSDGFNLNVKLLPAGSYILQLKDQQNTTYHSGIFHKS